MQQYLIYFRQCSLFARIPDDDLLRTLACLCARIVTCEKGKFILRQGDSVRHFGVVLSGSVHVITGDQSGNRNVMWSVDRGGLFAETYACGGMEYMPVSVMAAQDSLVLLLEYTRVITGCRNGCMAHSYLVTNLMRSVAEKNLQLVRKLEFVTQRTTRDKLTAYLRAQKQLSGNDRFVIPFDRQGLADYLGVDRSAMCAELSRMKKEGLIDYRKNEFEILNQPLEDDHD